MMTANEKGCPPGQRRGSSAQKIIGREKKLPSSGYPNSESAMSLKGGENWPRGKGKGGVLSVCTGMLGGSSQ